MDEGANLEERGNYEQALAAYVKRRQWDNAARVAASLDRNLEAAGYCLAAGHPYEAAVCYQKAGAMKECLEALMKVPPPSARYRHACVHAVRVAQMVGKPLDGLLSFLAPFISTRPASRAEATALVQFATAISRTEKAKLASSIYRTVLQAFPDDAEAREGLQAATAKEQEARPGATPPHGVAPSAPRPPLAPTPSATPAPLPSAPGGRKPKLADYLVAQGKVHAERLAKLLKEQPDARQSESALREALVARELVSDLEVVRALSELTGVPFIEERDLLATISPLAARALTVEQAERWQVVPISLVDRVLKAAMRDPRDIAVVDQLCFASGARTVHGLFATEMAIRRGIGKLYKGEEDLGQEDWRGQVWDPTVNPLPSAPFSDRFTRTREQQFDSDTLDQRMLAEAASEPELRAVDKSAPGRVQTIELPQLPMVGGTFAERYKVEALLGEGGSSLVFRAIDSEINEPVALKVFRPTTQKEAEQQLNRFKLELSLSRLLAHPNIIRLYHLGVQGQLRYLTMELLEGEDLGARLERLKGPLPIVEALGYLEQVCIALHTAHSRGVIHRDVKPQNIFVTKDGVAKLMDFGIAKRQQTRGVTITGVVAGTPEYISPEQISGFSTVTHKTDLYALGGTAFTLVTGAPPFSHPELMGLLMAQAQEPAPSPRSRNPLVPPELDAIILKLLQKRPDDRFESAAELGAALHAVRRSL